MSDQARPVITAATLGDIGLFGGLSEETLERLARELPRREITAGSVVVREGEAAKDMFVVIGGELEVEKSARDGTAVRVAVLGPGDWFGEMALIDIQPRSASVRAVAPSLVLRLDAEQVERLVYRLNVKDYALLIMNIARELSRRLRVADGILAQFSVSLHEQYQRGSGNR
jgi:CRP/FNR family transcriptional regulator, cyclic AMP receptor protein